jgi:hypothetical protein
MITLNLTEIQIKTLLNALAIAEMQMEEDDGKIEMAELGQEIFNQSGIDYCD